MNKRVLRILCILMCAVTTLCSCGKAEVDDTTVDSETATDNVVEYTKSHKGLTLSVYAPERVAHGEEFPVVARITNDSDAPAAAPAIRAAFSLPEPSASQIYLSFEPMPLPQRSL